MPSENETRRSSFRLSDEHLEMIDQIAEYYGGLTKTRVVGLSIELLHAEVVKHPHKKKTKKIPRPVS